MSPRRPRRLDGFDYLGTYRYFVTCCVLDRRDVFVDWETVIPIREQIVRTCVECEFEEIATTLMPDHQHSLFEGRTDAAAFVPFMKVLRQRTTRAFRQIRKAPLWQDGYFEHVLRDEEDTRGVVEYILMNPVRKKLVEKPEDYPFSWCKYGLRVDEIVRLRDD